MHSRISCCLLYIKWWYIMVVIDIYDWTVRLLFVFLDFRIMFVYLIIRISFLSWLSEKCKRSMFWEDKLQGAKRYSVWWVKSAYRKTCRNFMTLHVQGNRPTINNFLSFIVIIDVIFIANAVSFTCYWQILCRSTHRSNSALSNGQRAVWWNNWDDWNAICFYFYTEKAI